MMNDFSGLTFTDRNINHYYEEIKSTAIDDLNFMWLGTQDYNPILTLQRKIQKDNIDEEYQKCNELIQDCKAIEANLVLRRAYLGMLHIQIRRGKYSKIPGIYEKYKKVQNESDCRDDNAELSFSDTILALSKKLQGDKNAPEIKEFEKLAEKNKEGLPNFWQNYFLYQLLGSKKGKKFLKLSHDEIEELQSNLKGNELKSFSNTYYVKLILKEWEKINN